MPRTAFRFSDLVEQCLAQVDEPQAALVFFAESAGLVGARLQRSPAAAEEQSNAPAHASGDSPLVVVLLRNARFANVGAGRRCRVARSSGR